MDKCFTICQYKTEDPKKIVVSTPISLEVWLFFYEQCVLSLDQNWLHCKLILGSQELKM